MIIVDVTFLFDAKMSWFDGQPASLHERGQNYG